MLAHVMRHLEHLASKGPVLDEFGVNHLSPVLRALQRRELVRNPGPGGELSISTEYDAVLLDPFLLGEVLVGCLFTASVVFGNIFGWILQLDDDGGIVDVNPKGVVAVLEVNGRAEDEHPNLVDRVFKAAGGVEEFYVGMFSKQLNQVIMGLGNVAEATVPELFYRYTFHHTPLDEFAETLCMVVMGMGSTNDRNDLRI